MPKARRTSYNLAFKLKIVAEAEAVENNSEIAREYGISESMVRRWRRDQENLFNGEIKLSAKRKTMGCFTPKYPEMDQRARSIQPKFPEISVQNSMDRFGPTGKVSKKQDHLLRWSSFPGRTGLNFG